MTSTVLTALAEERAELAANVRRFFARRHDEERVRHWMGVPDQYDRALWADLAGGIGASALVVGEEYGGAGFSYADLLPVFEEAGRALYGGPLLSTAIATAALTACGDDVRAHHLPAVADGSVTATLALLESGGRLPAGWDADEIRTRAEQTDGRWRLTGVKTAVIDGSTADLLLVAARTDEGVRLFAVDCRSAEGVERTPLKTVDLTRKQARIVFASAPAALAGDFTAVRRALDVGALLFAAECLGGARRALDEAVAYAKVRHQFSRPIGSYQAVKHRLADMLLAAESAAVVLREAGAAAERSGAPVALDTLHALIACADALDVCAGGSQAVHGGISFTWEHSAHLVYRRARNAQTLLGPVSRHRERLAELAGLTGATS